MKLKSLLSKAAKCRTNEDARDLCFVLQDAFNKVKLLQPMEQAHANSDYQMEEQGPYAQFELNMLLSNKFCITVRPEIRGGQVLCAVMLVHFKDGHGLQSRSWEIYGNGEYGDFLEGGEDETVSQLAARAKEMAIRYHATLIEEVGVPAKAAMTAAKAAWKGTKV